MREKLVRFYKDEGLKEEILRFRFDGITISGDTSKPVTLYIRNVSGYELVNVRVQVMDNDVTVIPAVIDILYPDQVKAVSFSWHPELTREKPLDADIVVTAVVVKRV
jgi:hypothetical protein